MPGLRALSAASTYSLRKPESYTPPGSALLKSHRHWLDRAAAQAPSCLVQILAVSGLFCKVSSIPRLGHQEGTNLQCSSGFLDRLKDKL